MFLGVDDIFTKLFIIPKEKFQNLQKYLSENTVEIFMTFKIKFFTSLFFRENL